jgi:hypothetical protein
MLLRDKETMMMVIMMIMKIKKYSAVFSPEANSTDQSATAFWRYYCQPLG